jgi:hypothetical protein
MAPSVKAQIRAKQAERSIADESKAEVAGESGVKREAGTATPVQHVRKEQAKGDRAGVKVGTETYPAKT